MSFSVPDRRELMGTLLGSTAFLGTSLASTVSYSQPDRTRLSVLREQSGSFSVYFPNSPTLQVTFLTPEVLHLTVRERGPGGTQVPDYVRVRNNRLYSPVDVEVFTDKDELTFKSSSAIFNIAATDEVVTMDLQTPDKVLIDEWEIDTGELVARVELQNGERIYGFGDKRAAMDQRGHKVNILNRDAFASETNDSYKSIPFYMSSAGYGLFFHNYRPSLFDIGATKRKELRIKATGGALDFYIFVGNMKEILSQYTELTGRSAMLPYWAFGYHQAKATYRGREGLDVAAQLRQRKLPFDVIYYDAFDHLAISKPFIEELWDRYRARITVGFGMPMFGTWRGNDDTALLDDLAGRGYLMVDRTNKPAIGRDQHLEEEDEDRSSVAYLDYFSSAAVNHVFAAKWDEPLRNGAILGMVDFGELDHLKDPERKFWPSLGLSVAQTRNLFGLVYPMAVVNGVLERIGGRSTGMVRPGFAGSQRLGWTTTGDSLPTYRNFRAHTRGMLNLTLSGFSNVGQDIGGWDSKGGNTLYARWFAAATFFPFMWSHGKGDHEPYAHGGVVESAARTFLDLRYQLIPYLYSLHEHAHRTGVPVIRPLVLQEPADQGGLRIDDQFFVGDNIMVAPLFGDRDRRVYLPKGLWYDFFGEQQPVNGGQSIARNSVPLHRLPVFVRAGAVVPLGPAMQHTGEKAVDALHVNVYSFADSDLSDGPKFSVCSLYEDDGLSTAYLDGAFQKTHFRFHQDQEQISIEVYPESGDAAYRRVSHRAYHFQFHGVKGVVASVHVDNQPSMRGTNADAVSTGTPTWLHNEWSGDVSVFLPSLSIRALMIQIAVAPKAA